MNPAAHTLRRTRVAAAAIALLAAACTDSDDVASPPPPPSDPVDVARLFVEITPPGLASAVGLLPAALPMPVITTALTGSCPYDAAARAFVCTPLTSNGLAYAVSYTLFDAAGSPLTAQADRSTTASMRTLTSVSGTLPAQAPPTGGTTLPVGPLTISQQSDMTLTGLLGATHTLNGTTSMTVTGTLTFQGASTPVSSTTKQTITNVVLPPSSGGTGGRQYPTSGTITVDATSTLGAGAPAALATHAVMTFTGASTATLVVTSGGSTQRCTIDLATQAPPTCRAE